MQDLLAKLGQILGPAGIVTGTAVAERTSTYWNRKPMQARAILRPATVEQVRACLQLCQAAGQAVIPLGGNTGLAEATASSADDLMLSLERMQAIEEIDEVGRHVTVQAGVILQQLQQRVGDHGLLLPVDLGARGSCTIGGMLATNAGGFEVLCHGMMRDQVLGLEVVLADGTLISSLNRYQKNNTGYDLKQLFIGSEGTLGVITRAVLRLKPQPSARTTALLATNSFTQVVALLQHLDRQGLGALSAFEVMWQGFWEMNTGEYADLKSPFTQPHLFHILVEFQGQDAAQLGNIFEAALEHAYENELLTDALVAQSESERQAFWAIREAYEAEERYFDRTQGFDVSLPIRDMDRFVTTLSARLQALDAGAGLLVFGHLADGNLHLTAGFHQPLPDPHAVEQLVYTTLVDFHGAVSAEHGIGLEKKPYLAYSRHADEIALMRRFKQVLDPRGILNPGKIFDLDPASPAAAGE
ncbi:FAD-binding oxidoreductase [Halopseudomonas bauzanensis]|uniref:FAD-binding oxidoreductase n=1 Tax=Halopseudomonas bauzanensis TaxID=653930 RepID=A0A4U0YUE3_9GAMM|nr:FAD-binding oxidoreductase [Halopseudomonas bauzanensis]TKA92673.1 FAD-binding oxidoreductase [Halopseudomonas bauzanensis]